MVATAWPDDVARERRVDRKSMGSKTSKLLSKSTSTREYVVGKTAPLSCTLPGSSTEEWDSLIVVVRYGARPPATPTWRGAVLSATTDDSARRAFRELHAELVQLRQRDAFDEISSVLDSLAERGSTVHPMLLVAGLRLTYLYRSKISRWMSTRDEIAKALSSRGLDYSGLLRGLLE